MLLTGWADPSAGTGFEPDLRLTGLSFSLTGSMLQECTGGSWWGGGAGGAAGGASGGGSGAGGASVLFTHGAGTSGFLFSSEAVGIEGSSVRVAGTNFVDCSGGHSNTYGSGGGGGRGRVQLGECMY